MKIIINSAQITTIKNPAVVELHTVDRVYSFTGHEIIFDDTEHGRFLLVDLFGGIDSLHGGAVRFRHGILVRLHDNDTFKSLDKQWNDYTDIKEAALNDYDDSRPVLKWAGYMLERLGRKLTVDI